MAAKSNGQQIETARLTVGKLVAQGEQIAANLETVNQALALAKRQQVTRAADGLDTADAEQEVAEFERQASELNDQLGVVKSAIPEAETKLYSLVETDRQARAEAAQQVYNAAVDRYNLEAAKLGPVLYDLRDAFKAWSQINPRAYSIGLIGTLPDLPKYYKKIEDMPKHCGMSNLVHFSAKLKNPAKQC